jgi:hypothetical protein
MMIAAQDRLNPEKRLVTVNFSQEAIRFAIGQVVTQIPGAGTEKVALEFVQFIQKELGHCIRRDVPNTTNTSHDARVSELHENSVRMIQPAVFVATQSAARKLPTRKFHVTAGGQRHKLDVAAIHDVPVVDTGSLLLTRA